MQKLKSKIIGLVFELAAVFAFIAILCLIALFL